MAWTTCNVRPSAAACVPRSHLEQISNLSDSDQILPFRFVSIPNAWFPSPPGVYRYLSVSFLSDTYT